MKRLEFPKRAVRSWTKTRIRDRISCETVPPFRLMLFAILALLLSTQWHVLWIFRTPKLPLRGTGGPDAQAAGQGNCRWKRFRCRRIDWALTGPKNPTLPRASGGSKVCGVSFGLPNTLLRLGVALRRAVEFVGRLTLRLVSFRHAPATRGLRRLVICPVVLSSR